MQCGSYTSTKWHCVGFKHVGPQRRGRSVGAGEVWEGRSGGWCLEDGWLDKGEVTVWRGKWLSKLTQGPPGALPALSPNMISDSDYL